MKEFFEHFQQIPIEERKKLEGAYREAPSNLNHYSSGLFTYNDYVWEVDTLKELMARMDRESMRVKNSLKVPLK